MTTPNQEPNPSAPVRKDSVVSGREPPKPRSGARKAAKGGSGSTAAAAGIYTAGRIYNDSTHLTISYAGGALSSLRTSTAFHLHITPWCWVGIVVTILAALGALAG